MFAWPAGSCRQVFVAVCMFTWLATCFGSCTRVFVACSGGCNTKSTLVSTKLCIKLLLQLLMSQTSIWGHLLYWNVYPLQGHSLTISSIHRYSRSKIYLQICHGTPSHLWIMGTLLFPCEIRFILLLSDAIAGQNSLLCSKTRIWQPLAVWKVKLPQAKLGMICHASSPLG